MPIKTKKILNSKLSKSLVLYSIHIPILLLLLAFVGSFTLAQYSSEDSLVGQVLGKDSDDNDDEEDKDEDEDRDREDSDDNEDEKDSDEDRGSNSNSGSGSSSNSSVKPAVKNNEVKTEERVENTDGTYSIIETKEKDGEAEVEIITYNQNGDKLRVEKYENKEGEEEARVSVYDGLGNKISDFRLETEDGKELELRLKEGETELSRVRFDVEKQELLVKTKESSGSDGSNSSSDLRIRLLGNDFVLTRSGINALSKFPLVVDDATGEIVVQTPVGEVKLGAMPDSIVEKAKASSGVDDVLDLELQTTSESTSSSSSSLEFKLTGTKTEKLLGLFNLQIPTTLIYDANTGGFIRSEEPTFVTKILDLFSF